MLLLKLYLNTYFFNFRTLPYTVLGFFLQIKVYSNVSDFNNNDLSWNKELE